MVVQVKLRVIGIATKKSFETLKKLKDDETMVVQSGKPVAVFKTWTNSPRVVMANTILYLIGVVGKSSMNLKD